METATGTEDRTILRGKHPREIRDWKYDWMARWNQTEQFELLVSLLERGFSIQLNDHEDHLDRVLFYLKVATSYYEDDLQEVDEGVEMHPLDRELMWQHRKDLALAAFGELVKHFFVTEDRDFIRTGREPGWVRCVEDPRIIDALLDFFHVENWHEVRATQVHGQLPKQYAQAAGTFLLNLCKLGWLYHSTGRGHGYDRWVLSTDRSPALLLSKQPDLLERLIAMGKWVWLLDISQYPLTSASQKRLEQLAFAQGQYPNIKDPRGSRVKRKPSSLEEAVANHNEAAHILIIRRIKESEAARMAKIQSALDEAASATERLRVAGA